MRKGMGISMLYKAMEIDNNGCKGFFLHQSCIRCIVIYSNLLRGLLYFKFRVMKWKGYMIVNSSVYSQRNRFKNTVGGEVEF